MMSELHRGHITDAIGRASRLPVVLLVAPAGSGKSVAVRQYLESSETPAISFDVRASHASLSRFVRGLASALEPVLPKVSQSLAIAHERALQSPRPADVLATWVAEHLASEPRTIVLNDFHHCERDRDIAAFVAGAIERTRETTKWIVTMRCVAELPLAVWLARGDTDVPIDGGCLKVTTTEAQRFAAHLAPGLDDSLVARIAAATKGSIGQVVFALRSAAADATTAVRALDARGDAFECFVDEALASLGPNDREFVRTCAIFPDLDEGLLATLDCGDGVERIAAIREKLPYVFDERSGRPTFESPFAGVLVARLASEGADALFRARADAGRALEACDRIVEALAYYIGGRDFSAIARLIDARGLAFVDAGYGDAIADAIGKLDPLVQNNSSVILATKAMFESRLGRFDLAESWFQLALERSSDPEVRDRIAYQYGVHLLRFFRPEAIEMLEGLAHGAAVASDLRAYAFSALGPAFVSAGRMHDAAAAAARAIALIGDGAAPHLRARALHQAAYVALYRNESGRAREFASHSLAIANEHGYFDVAAGALTVLYNAASDIDDDPVESSRLLDAVADCAAKSGSLVNHLLALIAKLEIETERGDEDAIAHLDEKLKIIDVRAGGRAIYEALLASQALRASWTGDFTGAFHLVASSAVLQWSDDRKALRWAEIAVYAIAAGLGDQATSAIRSSFDLVEKLEASPRRTRTNLYLALALVLSGRSEAASDVFASIDAISDTLSPRTLAMRRMFGALHDRYRGARNHVSLLGLFGELETHHYGGVARMLKMLPLGDNATLRIGDLNAKERRLVLRIVTDAPSAIDRNLDHVVTKLGCIDRRAVVRALTRQASPIATFEKLTRIEARA